MKNSLADIIKEMIAPYHDGIFDEVDLLVTIAQCAWNMDILPEHLSKEILDEFLSNYGEEEVEELINAFYLYKKMNYSEDKRFFVDYDFIRVDNERLYKFEVHSMPYNKETILKDFHILKDKGLDEEGSYVFTVKLRPGCWRRIQINKNATLNDLHGVILDAFEFDDDHLYSFFMSKKAWSGTCYSSPNDTNGEDASEIQLFQLGLREKDQFVYIYDYGANWRFSITLFKELDTTLDKAEVITIKGEAPDQY